MKTSAVIALVMLGSSTLLAGTASAAPGEDLASKQQQIINQKEQEQTSKRAERSLQYRASQKMTTAMQAAGPLEVFSLPSEENSFKIRHFALKSGAYGDTFAWIDEYLAKFNGQKIGVQGINELMRRINTEIVNRGYATTRVYVETQDLSRGRMMFTLLPGTISDIRFRKEHTWGTWMNAMPMHRGSLLNIRDIEQAIDNFNSVPNQKADIQIEPGPEEGQSDLVIDVEREKPWVLSVTVDNSGTDTTGKVQISSAVQIAQPFSANDIFYASWNTDASQAGETKGTRADSLYYAVPFGNDRLAFSYSKNEYHQTVDYAVNPFKSSGEFTNISLTWTHLLSRGQNYKTDLEWGLVHKTRHSYIDGTEIEVQRQKTTAMQMGIVHRQYMGPSVLDASLTWRKGVHWWADPGPTDGMSG